MKLWPKEIVKEVMTSQEFAEASAKHKQRSASSKKAAKTKALKTLDEFKPKLDEIKVSVVSEKNLRKWVLEEKQLEYLDKNQDFTCPDEYTVRRWMVNYIRHKLTNYDSELYNLSGCVGKNEAYKLYKCAVLDEIAKAYPYLSNACQAQKDHMDEKDSMVEAYLNYCSLQQQNLIREMSLDAEEKLLLD